MPSQLYPKHTHSPHTWRMVIDASGSCGHFRSTDPALTSDFYSGHSMSATD